MALESGGGAARVTVSQEVLRLELDNVALRIINEVDKKLTTKANAADVHDLRDRVGLLEVQAIRREGPFANEVRQHDDRIRDIERQLVQGRKFTEDEKRQMNEALSQRLRGQTAEAWSTREKAMGVVLFFISLVTFGFTTLSVLGR